MIEGTGVLEIVTLSLSLAHAEASSPGDLPGRVQVLDWPTPRVCGLLINSPWPIRNVHPVRLMYDVACGFLRTVAPRPPEDVLSGLVAALEVALVDLKKSAGKDDFDGLWDLGGYLALAATDGHAVSVARAGDVRVVALTDSALWVQQENTLAAEFRAKGIGAGQELPENVITAYVGNGQLPVDLIRNVDTENVRRLLFCTLGAARGFHDDRLASLGRQGDPRFAAKAVLDARLEAAARSEERWRTMATCVIDVSHQVSSNG
jgi:hypothetical protein